MAISDYAGLVEAVQKWMARSDSTFTNRIPDFVLLAEDRIYNGSDLEQKGALYTPPLRTRVLEETTSLTFTDGVADFPADYLEARRLFRASDLVGLTYLPPKAWSVRDAYATTGNPLYFTIEDGQFKTTPGYDGAMSLLYWRQLDPLTTEANSNALLIAHPMVYLTAALFEAFSFIQEPDLAMGHLVRLRGMISGLNRTATAARTAGGHMRVMPRNPIP